MKTKADGYYVVVKNEKGYPREYTELKVTHDDFTCSWFGGGWTTRTALFKKYEDAIKFGRREVKRLNKKMDGEFVMRTVPIKIFQDGKA